VKRRYVLAVLAVIPLFALAAGLALERSDASPRSFRGSTPPRGITLPDFSLRNASGEIVDADRLRGKTVLVTFLETKCKEACPIIANQIGKGLALLTLKQRGRVVAVAISTHPTDDTATSVREFLRRHRVEGKLHYLVGSERELRPVWRAFHILPALDSGDPETHSAPVRIFSPAGEWVSTLHPGIDLTPLNLANDALAAGEMIR